MDARCSAAGAPRDASASPSRPGTATSTARSAPAAGRWGRGRRLLRRADFRAAYETGLRRSSAHFTVFGVRTPPAAPGPRFGITVSRKLGSAVVRNRIRRRTREMLRRQSPTAAAAGCQIVVNPRPSVAAADFEATRRELEALVETLCLALQNSEPRPCAS